MSMNHFSLPRLSVRFVPIWRRHFLVWKKVAATSVIGHIADPMIYLLGLGYGLGSFLPEMGGTSYMMFLAAGTVCYSTMNSASFEALYSGFSRMHEQRTWDAILNTPVTLDDVVLAEILWAASKSLMAGVAVLVVVWLMGMSHTLLSLWAIPLALLVGLCFASIGLIMTALAPSYDFFMYYFTLVITPMMLLCGVFFPVTQLPPLLQEVSAILPLSHAVDIARPLLNGQLPAHVMTHVAVLLLYTVFGFYVSLVLFRRRLSR
ncbi:Inner membrane transport permease YadH [Gallionellaceae bacterium]|nr:Inner membrane transport permease YadH [Gallionellaceae bacterium]